jgi:biotin carboxyl carrier protein
MDKNKSMKYSVSSSFLQTPREITVSGDTLTIQPFEQPVADAVTFERDAERDDVFYALQGNTRTTVIVIKDDTADVRLSINGYTYSVQALSERDRFFQHLLKATATKAAATTKVVAPMPGLLKAAFVENGQRVKKGERLFILEAMKMENDIKASQEGIVANLNARIGVAIEKNFLLCVIEALPAHEA